MTMTSDTMLGLAWRFCHRNICTYLSHQALYLIHASRVAVLHVSVSLAASHNRAGCMPLQASQQRHPINKSIYWEAQEHTEKKTSAKRKIWLANND
ncbi:hypothetical protein PVAP13_2NG258903 [Panicum virgatum]|uniref:Uncharacterized protein n=1 Tax=Panicum virgatum TaxID=38727 RepID=A0A8T0VIH8_PANVG|nr:hypothetical protein PVAP13_2NG258903 [Panicum virgatum]